VLLTIYQQQILLNTVLLSEKQENLNINLLKEKIINLPKQKFSLNELENTSEELASSGVLKK
jgi:hypothetical protein